jgi:hypothetical protein
MNIAKLIDGGLWIPAALILGVAMLIVLGRNDRRPSGPARPETETERDRRLLGLLGKVRYPTMTPDSITMTIETADGRKHEATRRTERECLGALQALANGGLG